MKHLLSAVGINFVSWIVTMTTMFAFAYGMDVIGQPMSWYTNVWLLIGLYGAPSVMVLIGIHTLAKHKIYEVSSVS